MNSPATTPRSLEPDDAEPARALVAGALGATPYMERIMEILAGAESGDPESRGLVIERSGKVEALALYGPVAGAADAWRIRIVLMTPTAGVPPRQIGGVVGAGGVGRELIEAVVDRVKQEGARLLTAELPADAALGRSLTLLRSNGFQQEARIPDFYRDGVALLFLRRPL